MQYFKRILKYLHNYKLHIFLIFVVQLLYAVFSVFTLTLVVPFLQVLFNQTDLVTTMPSFSLTLRYFIDAFYYLMGVIIIRGGRVNALIFIAVTMVVLSLLSNLCRYAGMFWLSHIRAGILYNIRKEYYSKLLVLPLQFYSDARSGDLVSRFSADVLEVEWTIISSLLTLCRDPFLMIAYIVTIVSISPKLSIIALVIIPVMGLLLSVIGKNIRNYSLKTQQFLGTMTSYFEEAVDGLRIIKGYNAQKHVSKLFFQENQQVYELNKKILRIKESGSPIVELLSIFTLMIISLIGLLAFPENFAMKGSAFLLFFVVFARMIPPAKSLASTYYQIKKGLSAAARVYEIIDSQETTKEIDNPLHIKQFENNIRFNNVSFSYKSNNNQQTLKNVSFTINKGETIAIVGPSGSGKSTLINLLPRFYDVSEGTVTIDDTNINDYSLEELRNLYGIVNQDIILFNDSVYNNIVFGTENITEEQVVEAAKIAQAHDFILDLEDGYNTVIGNRGMRLSGGQRQRLSIARAVLRNPQIFIFDEATSALDNESEKLFQDALNLIKKSHTTIVIAHRMSTIRNADKIVFLKNGEVSEFGTHEELMSLNGDYYRFFSAQQMSK